MKWLGKFPDSFLAEIAGQPDALRRAARALTEQLDTIEAVRDAGRRTGGGVVFTGMGASYDACYPAVNELAVNGVLALQIDAAELLHFRIHVLSAATVLVIVSQSGQSAEVVRLLDAFEDRAERPAVLSVTNGLANPLAERADLRLDTRAGTEQGPSTMTFAASLVQLAAVAGALSGRSDVDPVGRATTAAREASDAVETVLDTVETVLEDETLAARIADVADHDTLVVLARGPARAAAEMGALTLKECGVTAESYETAAFRHGPFELAGPALGAIVVATEPETLALDLGLAADLLEAGASVVVLSSGSDVPDGALGVRIPSVDRLLSSAVSIVPIQLLAWRLANARGRVPGAYTRSSKVTTRE
ncbi:MAG TPA: SIS domain-containing protein [Actinomycetota bacterium]|nr:SIS domain-containing protein [Actinomycetota bacterium]